MTGSAFAVGNFGAIGKGQGLMHLMTLDAIIEFLIFNMRFVAVQAVRFVAVFVVAERAVDLGMRTGCGVDLIDNAWMAGVASGFYFTLKGYVKRLMGVGMAAETVLKREVRLSLMTVRTLGDKGTFFGSGRVISVMAGETGDLCFMFGSGLVNLLNIRTMAFLTVVILELGLPEGCISRLDISH